MRTYEYSGEQFTVEQTKEGGIIVKDSNDFVSITIDQAGRRRFFIVRSNADDVGIWTYDLERGIRTACQALLAMRAENVPEKQVEEFFSLSK